MLCTGEAMGILAGDALLNLAYETAAKAFDMEVADARVARAITVLAKKGRRVWYGRRTGG